MGDDLMCIGAEEIISDWHFCEFPILQAIYPSEPLSSGSSNLCVDLYWGWFGENQMKGHVHVDEHAVISKTSIEESFPTFMNILTIES